MMSEPCESKGHWSGETARRLLEESLIRFDTISMGPLDGPAWRFLATRLFRLSILGSCNSCSTLPRPTISSDSKDETETTISTFWRRNLSRSSRQELSMRKYMVECRTKLWLRVVGTKEDWNWDRRAGYRSTRVMLNTRYLYIRVDRSLVLCCLVFPGTPDGGRQSSNRLFNYGG